jgi:YD repeat-containing protein
VSRVASPFLLFFTSIYLGVSSFSLAQTQSVACGQLGEEGEPLCAQAAGNPINVTTGNKHQREVDMPSLPGVLGLELIRHYNSAVSKLSDAPSMLGRGWRLSYDWALRFDHGNHNEQIVLVQGDGTQHFLTKSRPKATRLGSGGDSANSRGLWDGSWRALGGQPGILKETRENAGNAYVWSDALGQRYQFNMAGLLVGIEAPSGETLKIEREKNGDISRVIDPQGRSLQVSLLSDATALRLRRFGGAQSIDTPLGKFEYQYGGEPPSGSKETAAKVLSRLIAVRHADITRHYIYEDPRFPCFLSGIRIVGMGSDRAAIDQRVASWAYDDHGRAVMSVKGSPSDKLEKITLRFEVGKPTARNRTGAGVTYLTNSLGETTEYRFAQIFGRPQLTEVTGPGCATCGPSNIRYRYDLLGRTIQTSQLDQERRELLAEIRTYDDWHRLTQIRVVKPTLAASAIPQDFTKFEYGLPGPFAWPTSIIRKSVVANQEFRTDFEYNERGQITKIGEHGFSPIRQSGLETPVAIARTTLFRYQPINGRSALIEIDGPLSNGPLNDVTDSDITQFHYDSGGHLLKSQITPTGYKTHFVYDHAGRMIRRTFEDGFRSITAKIQYTPFAFLANQAAELVLEGRFINVLETPLQLKVFSTSFDALGRGTRHRGSADGEFKQDYDLAGRPIGTTDERGYRSKQNRDSEGRVTMAGLYPPEPYGEKLPAVTEEPPHRASYQSYDVHGRLRNRLLADGRSDSFGYDKEGVLNLHQQSHGAGREILHLFRTALANTTIAKISQSSDGYVRMALSGDLPERNGEGSSFQLPAIKGQNLKDDFGRIVKRILPDHGNKFALFDAADKVLEVHSADGSAMIYRYDQAGRTIRIGYRSTPESFEEVQASYTYAGVVLTEIRSQAQTSRYLHDALGRRTQESISFEGLGSTKFDVSTQYDPATGFVSATGLANGQMLRIKHNGSDFQGLHLQSGWAYKLDQLAQQHFPTRLASWARARIPSKMIASDLEVHPYDGLKAYTFGNGLRTSHEHDKAGRLIGTNAEGIGSWKYQYGVGPRIMKIEQQSSDPIENASATKASFSYRSFAGLKHHALSDPVLPAELRRFDSLGRTHEDNRYRYTYTPQGQIASVSRQNGALIAIYRYNHRHERVSKTIWAEHSAAPSTTFYLWQNQRIAAEVDQRGTVTSQYIYLKEGQIASPFAKLESRANPDNPTKTDRILYVHNDHRAMPVALTNDQRSVV